MRRQEHADQSRDGAAQGPTQRHAPQRERVGDLSWREFVDVGRRQRQQHAEAEPGQHAQAAKCDKRGAEQRRQHGEHAGDPQAAKQRSASPEAVSDGAVNERPDEEADEPARYQEPRLPGQQSPRLCHVVDDVGGIERIVSVKQSKDAHGGAKTPVEGADLGLRQFLMDVDHARFHGCFPSIMGALLTGAPVN
jgi:hypothetical protein